MNDSGQGVVRERIGVLRWIQARVLVCMGFVGCAAYLSFPIVLEGCGPSGTLQVSPEEKDSSGTYSMIGARGLEYRYYRDGRIEVREAKYKAQFPRGGFVEVEGLAWPHRFSEAALARQPSDGQISAAAATRVSQVVGRRWHAGSLTSNADSTSSGVPSGPDATRIAEWAEVLEQHPDPKVIPSESLRAAITATGLPWRVRERAAGIEMLLVPPGTFVMGMSPGDEYADPQEVPSHEVCITRPYYLGRFEVTVEQVEKILGFWREGPERIAEYQEQGYRRFARDAPESGWPIYDLMSMGLTREEASRVAPATVDRDACGEFLAKAGLRLPTEAEWEFACRAGTADPQYGPIEEIACFRGNSGGTAHPIGSWRANPLGFHDMLGNVWEHVAGRYGQYPTEPQIDPRGPASGDVGVLRGGRWSMDVDGCRASKRFPYLGGWGAYWPGMLAPGFRVARDP